MSRLCDPSGLSNHPSKTGVTFAPNSRAGIAIAVPPGCCAAAITPAAAMLADAMTSAVTGPDRVLCVIALASGRLLLLLRALRHRLHAGFAAVARQVRLIFGVGQVVDIH